MSNPFSKYVKDPANIPDPNKVTLQQFQKYHSHEMTKLNALFRSVRKSGLYLAGVFGVCWVYTAYRLSVTQDELFGSDCTLFLSKTRAAHILTCTPGGTRSTTPTTGSSSGRSTWRRDR